LAAYSHLNTEFKQKFGNIYLYGIGAWEYAKMGILRGRSETAWNTDLSSQLEYVHYDLYNNYPTLLGAIKSQPLNEASVSHAVELIIKSYNSHINSNEVAHRARDYAIGVYSRLVITQGQTIGDTTVLRDVNGNELTAQYSVSIPGIPQTGIIDDYTNYSHWYSKWNKRSPQKKLANLWGEQGFPCDKGIATIGGYYCCAVRPKFGRCGELIVVTLEDNTTFTGIICDEKGEDAGSEWGHVKGGGNISLIEWERVKTVDGKVITTGTTAAGVDPKGYTDIWYGKKVNNITNYGKYINVGWS
jgi:hypothetical protein